LVNKERKENCGMPGISAEGQQRELEKETSSGHEAALAIDRL